VTSLVSKEDVLYHLNVLDGGESKPGHAQQREQRLLHHFFHRIVSPPYLKANSESAATKPIRQSAANKARPRSVMGNKPLQNPSWCRVV
jgi:hypothetical protein